MSKEAESRQSLIKYVPESREHTHEQVEAALDHFIDPKNENAEFNAFANSVAEKLIGTTFEQATGTQRKIYEEIHKLVGQVENARRFNDTYLGHMLSEACIPAMWGQIVATRIGSNTVAKEVSMKETALEKEGIHFLMDIVGYDKKKASGTFTTGGTMAVMTALAVARKKFQAEFEEAFEPKDPNPTAEARRLSEIEKRQHRVTLHVLATDMAHYSFRKHMNLLAGPYGELDLRIEEVATKGFKMDVDDLRAKIKQIKAKNEKIMAIYAIPGETETGLIDPLEEIIEIARKENIFTIADAAYGAMYRQSRIGDRFALLPEFDAIILDPHKTLYTPYPNGAVLFKSAEDHDLLAAGIDGPYVGFKTNREDRLKGLRYETDDFSLGQKRIEGSGTAGSILSTVMVARTLGTDSMQGLKTVLDITLDRINHLNEVLKSSQHLTPVHEPELNLVCFRLNEETERRLGLTENDPTERQKHRKNMVEQIRFILDNGIQGRTGYYFSDTDLKLSKDSPLKIHVFRACLMNPRTSDKILDESIGALENLIEETISASDKDKFLEDKIAEIKSGGNN